MKVLLMYRDRDFDLPEAPPRNADSRKHVLDFDLPKRSPWNATALTQDLDLETIWRSMAQEDEFLFEVARKAFLDAFNNDMDTVLYRQQVLKDCIHHREVAVQLYNIAVEAIVKARKSSWGMTSHYPSSMLYGATDTLQVLVDILRRLRGIAEQNASAFESEGFKALFSRLTSELGDEYLASIEEHLAISKFHKGVLLTAQLGDSNECSNLILRKLPKGKHRWFGQIFSKGPPAYTFHLHERDEAGARILSNLRDRSISRVAVVLAESADHVLSFFTTLRAELAFYVGAVNLHERLVVSHEPVCFPVPNRPASRQLRFGELYDVSLSLRTKDRVVGNTLDATGKNLVVITGANQGGKSTFLRSLGLAQIMMQSGMFVGAETFGGELSPAMCTHYKREEDASMKSGKFDEELARMGEIADHVSPNATILFNESFAATNEREGSEIARQIVSALLEKHIRVFYVTHMFEFARSFFDDRRPDAAFLRAERMPDGTRTFKLGESEPLETSFGQDLYRNIFGADDQGEGFQSKGQALVSGLRTEN
ncbi:MAG: hypothetical protein WBQ34_07015 [Candidatus Acidiferrales bacterium]